MHKAWTLTHQGYTSWEIKNKEEMNSGIEVLLENPQDLDQSKRVRIKPSKIWLSTLKASSKVRWLRSFQIVHIKQAGTKFQMSDEWRPKPFHQLNKRSATVPEITQRTPKAWKTQFQRPPALGQWRRRCSTVSPLQRHIQHQLVI